MNVDLSRVSRSEKPILRHLLQLYLHDFSEFMPCDVSRHGLFSYPYLDLYWTEAGRYPYLIRVDGRIAGFILVNSHTYLDGPPETKAIAEFFIMRAYRRRHVGAQAARLVFSLFPGPWEVQETHANTVAQAFWRKVLSDYTGGDFDEVLLDDDRWKGPVQRFRSK